MRRIAGIGLITVVMLAASVPASAQGLNGFQASIPGAGIFGRYFGGFAQDLPERWTPTLSVGYVTHRKGVIVHSDYYDESYYEDIAIPLQGLWLEGSVDLLGGAGFGFMLRGGILVPVNSKAHNITTISANLVGVLQGVSSRPHNQWSIVEAIASYEPYSGVQFLGGFRWDHFATKLTNDNTWSPGESHYKVNAYLPVVGVQTVQGNAATRASAGVLGFPVVPGNFRFEWNGPTVGIPYHEQSSQFWNKGYFFECFFRFNQRLYGTTTLGAFATFSVLHAATGHGSYDWTEPMDAGTLGLEYVFHRQSWTFGGSLSVDFTTL